MGTSEVQQQQNRDNNKSLMDNDANLSDNEKLVGSFDSEKAKQDLENARNEWDNVDEIVPVFGTKLHRVAIHCNPTVSITFEAILEHFKARDMSEYMVGIVPVIHRSWASSAFRKVFGPEKLLGSLESSRDLVFAIASCPLQNDEIIHFRVLQTIYRQLTNCRRDVSRYGPHWDVIGFQGNDPSTDLRGVGFLALMHLLYLVMEPSTLPLAKSILKLSHHSTQNFPFAVMGINITRIVLQSLREERLNKECNKAKDVISVTNKFYAGVFLRLYETWLKDKLTITDCSWVLKGIEYNAKKKPKVIFQNLKNYLEKHPQLPVISTIPPKMYNASPELTPRISHMEPYPMADFRPDFILEVPETNDLSLDTDASDACATPQTLEMENVNLQVSESEMNDSQRGKYSMCYANSGDMNVFKTSLSHCDSTMSASSRMSDVFESLDTNESRVDKKQSDMPDVQYSGEELFI